MDRAKRGKLAIISGPSGAGKTTVVRGVLEKCPLPLKLSVSATTRQPRVGEVGGVDYYFMSKVEFDAKREAGEFLECFEVFGSGYWYGTLRDEVTASLAGGTWVILEIDVNGALAVTQECPEAITIFLRPESLADLENRLRGRGSETEESIQRRLEVARREWQLASRYKHDVVNQTVDQAVNDICRILLNSEKSETC